MESTIVTEDGSEPVMFVHYYDGDLMLESYILNMN